MLNSHYFLKYNVYHLKMTTLFTHMQSKKAKSYSFMKTKN